MDLSRPETEDILSSGYAIKLNIVETSSKTGQISDLHRADLCLACLTCSYGETVVSESSCKTEYPTDTVRVFPIGIVPTFPLPLPKGSHRQLINGELDF